MTQVGMKKMLVGIGFTALFAAVFLGYIGNLIYSSEQSFLNWPTVQGRILSVDVQSMAKAAVSGTATSTMQNYWMVLISYKYVIAGHEYTGDRLSNSPPMENEDTHAKPSTALTVYLDRYPAGSDVQVHYNPDKPERSFLEISTSSSRSYLYVAAGSLILALLMFGWYFLLVIRGQS